MSKSIEEEFQGAFSQFRSAGGGEGTSSSGGFFGGFMKNNSSSTLAASDGVDSTSLLSSFNTGLSSIGLGSIGGGVDSAAKKDAECFGLSSFQRYTGFAMMMAASLLFFTISLFTLPMIVLLPGKFASSFTFGSLLFLSSFTVLNGWRAHLKHLFCWDRAVFTSAYLASMLGCLYFSVISASYLGVLFFTATQMVCLAWYFASYFPGGTSFMSRMMLGSAASSLPV